MAKYARERGVSCAAPVVILKTAKGALRPVVASSRVPFSLESAIFWTQVNEEWRDPMEVSRSSKRQPSGQAHLADTERSPQVRKYVTANVLTLHPAEQRMVGNNTSSRAAQLQAMAARAGAFAVGIQSKRPGRGRVSVPRNGIMSWPVALMRREILAASSGSILWLFRVKAV